MEKDRQGSSRGSVPVNRALLHALAEKFPNRELVLTELGLLRAPYDENQISPRSE